MGMYTELVCAFELKQDTPVEIIEILKYMLGDIEEPKHNLNHDLFNTSRWDFMLQSDSYYFDGTTHSFLKVDHLYKDKPMYFLNVRCNLKNYDDEIEKFIDWIKPYISENGTGKFIGYKRYETENEPTLIYI